MTASFATDPTQLYLVLTICDGHKHEIAEDPRNGVLYLSTFVGIVPTSPMNKWHGHEQPASWSATDHTKILDVEKKTLFEFVESVTTYVLDHIVPQKEEECSQ